MVMVGSLFLIIVFILILLVGGTFLCKLWYDYVFDSLINDCFSWVVNPHEGVNDDELARRCDMYYQLYNLGLDNAKVERNRYNFDLYRVLKLVRSNKKIPIDLRIRMYDIP